MFGSRIVIDVDRVFVYLLDRPWCAKFIAERVHKITSEVLLANIGHRDEYVRSKHGHAKQPGCIGIQVIRRM